MNLKRILGLAVTAVGCLSLAAAPAVTDNPYGVCSHVSWRDFDLAQQEYQLMHEAKINWVRTDFHWKGVEPKPGSWDFSRFDQVVSLAKRENIQILPILCDYVPYVPWANPAWEHLDAWGEYVRGTVSRYAKDLRYWEVWNEQNSVDPVNSYLPMLKRTYEEIKKIDPKLNVGFGGLNAGYCGVHGAPLGYIEDALKAGAGKYFDFMNLHPYRMEGIPEDMIPELRGLKALMKRYGVGDKPLWITEVGWGTLRLPIFLQKALQAALRRAGIDPAKTAAAVICDPEKGYSSAALFVRDGYLAKFRRVNGVRFDQLRGLSVERFPVLVPASGDRFPAKYIPELVDYVKRGGTLILPSGLPFYYDQRADGNTMQIGDKHMKDFHIGWETSWTNKDVPKKESYQKPAAGFEGAFQITQADFRPASRFLHGRNLKPGDEFIPVIEAGTETYKGAVAALYKLNSDLKGNIIVCTRADGIWQTPEFVQAEMLPRSYLVALANGVERIFWYNFRSAGYDPGTHFGIVQINLKPKPAFQAYKTLTRLCPAGSTVPSLTHQGETFLSGWTRPDGTKVWAVWNVLHQRKIRLDVRGNVTEALNHLGEKQPVSGGEAVISPAILYLVGPESVSLPL